MTEKEKIIEIISDVIWRYEPLLKYEPTPAPPEIPTVPEAIADALIAAKFRDTTWQGAIFMNGEAIVPSPDIYNKVAKLLDCPLMLDVPDERHVLSDGTTENDDKRRAEVAEKALRNLAQFCAKSARFYLQSNKAVKEREQELYDEWIAQAEKDLAEEKKQ